MFVSSARTATVPAPATRPQPFARRTLPARVPGGRAAAAPPPRPGGGERLRLRTVWISDVHLGTRACKADYLLDFLAHTEAERLYLVGDMIDFWNLRNGWYWPASHNRVVQAIMDKAARGTEVIYVPGNHDELFRDYAGAVFGGVRVERSAIHETADGRRLLVLHGDEFDQIVQCSPWLAHLGSWIYDFLLYANRWVNLFRRTLGFPYWSLAAYLKHKVKNAVNYISNFEQALAHEARRYRVDGVVCGHIHKAAIEKVGEVLYCNDGDWVESCTALVERADGALAVLHWADERRWLLAEPRAATAAMAASAEAA
jgi:UDP-2,3-diacylglucosamine pyrophosphatase LpxH